MRDAHSRVHSCAWSFQFFAHSMTTGWDALLSHVRRRPRRASEPVSTIQAESVGTPGIIFLAIVLSLVPHDMMYGPQAALIAESFTGRLRYSGSSLGYQLASIIAGGPAPLIAIWLFGLYHMPYAIAADIAICALLSLIATALMRDHTGKDIDGEYERR